MDTHLAWPRFSLRVAAIIMEHFPCRCRTWGFVVGTFRWFPAFAGILNCHRSGIRRSSSVLISPVSSIFSPPPTGFFSSSSFPGAQTVLLCLLIPGSSKGLDITRSLSGLEASASAPVASSDGADGSVPSQISFRVVTASCGERKNRGKRLWCSNSDEPSASVKLTIPHLCTTCEDHYECMLAGELEWFWGWCTGTGISCYELLAAQLFM
ncbi:hypothetical protein NDU88_001624 [Pleurodeles waltl]|uniref:Uncharacterized protein n=1 Tax=Pleurodeles waltl TaxID=8319 RepID=A0AAV7T125_PLEWA|nr:hypothetical protein NDU88_001624 [Pleurodeles waltl]